MNINEIMGNIKEEVLTEEAKSAIVQAFNEQVENGIKEKVELEVKAALVEQDELHTTKLEKLLEAIDEDHAAKLDMIIQKIDEDHSEKLKTMASKYEYILKEDAEEFKSDLITKMSSYLDMKVKELIPLEAIKEACENTRARKLIDEVKKILVIDSAYFNKTIKEAVNEGKETIDSLQEDLKSALKENVKLQQQLMLIESKSVLDEVTKDLTKEKATYVRKMLKEKSPEYIKENVDYILNLYEESLKDQVFNAADVASKKTKVITENVDVPEMKKTVITESTKKEDIDDYLKSLQGLDGKQ